MELFWNILVFAIASALVIFIVGKLNLGIEVDSFGSAVIVALVIAVVAGIVSWLLGLLNIAPGTGWFGALIGLIIAAIVLMISSRITPGVRTNGFAGALIAAVAIGVVAFLLNWVLGIFGLGVPVVVV